MNTGRFEDDEDKAQISSAAKTPFTKRLLWLAIAAVIVLGILIPVLYMVLTGKDMGPEHLKRPDAAVPTSPISVTRNGLSVTHDWSWPPIPKDDSEQLTFSTVPYEAVIGLRDAARPKQAPWRLDRDGIALPADIKLCQFRLAPDQPYAEIYVGYTISRPGL